MRLLNINASDIMAAFKAQYTDEVGNQMIIGSEEYTLSLIYAYCISVLVARFNTAYMNCSLETAQGEALDNIGNMYGVQRVKADEAGKTYLDVCFGLRQPDVVTTSTHFNICGMDFTPEVISINGGYTVARLVTNSTINEDIPIETIRESLDKIAYDRYLDFIYIDAQSSMYPIANKFEYSESGDNAYRKHIKENRFINLTGTAKAFEQYTKQLHPSIKDSVVIRQNDVGYVEGVVQIYVKIDGYNKYAPYACDNIVLDYINNVFDDDRMTVVGQTRKPIEKGVVADVYRPYAVRIPKTVAYQDLWSFYEAIIYYYNTRMHFGSALNDSEIQSLMLKTLREISNNPADFNLSQADYDRLASVKCITSKSQDDNERYIKPATVNEYIQLRFRTPSVVERV